MSWDSSVLEKPESRAAPARGAVRSSKAQRLTRITPGFSHPPSRPLFVPGWQWLGRLLLGHSGRSGPPTVVHMRWWSPRGPQASDRRTEEGDLLRPWAQRWGRRVCHVGARGFAGTPGLDEVLARPLRFVLRWPGRYNRLGPRTGWHPAKAGELARGQRSWDHRLLWDARRHCERRTGVLAVPVWRPDDSTHARPRWLVVARRGRGQEPWYLLTSEPVHTAEQAGQVVFASARRGPSAMSWRSGKSELAMESPRLWSGERRLKLLLLATLAYAFLHAFLLSLLAPPRRALRHGLLRDWCHRTGKRSPQASTPLYRLRSALSRLWLAYLPTSHPILQSSG